MEAKVWLDDLSVAVNVRYPMHELNATLQFLAEHREDLVRQWHEHFGD